MNAAIYPRDKALAPELQPLRSPWVWAAIVFWLLNLSRALNSERLEELYWWGFVQIPSWFPFVDVQLWWFRVGEILPPIDRDPLLLLVLLIGGGLTALVVCRRCAIPRAPWWLRLATFALVVMNFRSSLIWWPLADQIANALALAIYTIAVMTATKRKDYMTAQPCMP